MNAFKDFFIRSEKAYETVDCGTLKNLIENGEDIRLVDVRTEREHFGGHIPNSININLMSPTFVSKLDKLNRDHKYYIYCASGNRSKTACSQMAKMGFKTVYNVRMGMMGWSGTIE